MLARSKPWSDVMHLTGQENTDSSEPSKAWSSAGDNFGAHMTDACCAFCAQLALPALGPSRFPGFCPACWGLATAIEDNLYLVHEAAVSLAPFLHRSQDLCYALGVPAEVRAHLASIKLLDRDTTDPMDLMRVLRNMVREAGIGSKALSESPHLTQPADARGVVTLCMAPTAAGEIDNKIDMEPPALDTDRSLGRRRTLYLPPRKKRRGLHENTAMPDTPKAPKNLRNRPWTWAAAIQIRTASLLVYAKYKKYCRDLGQSRWTGGDGGGAAEIPKYSIEELLADKLCPLFKAECLKLNGCGREDWDVRMLGSGREILCEVCEPRTGPSYDLKEVEAAVIEACHAAVANTGVFLSDISVRLVSTQSVSDCIRDFDMTNKQDRVKVYGLVIKTSRPIREDLTIACPVTIQQKTPIRVLHRRAWKIRPKIIHELQIDRLTDELALVRVVASGGTYIKEFVHGDLGRTKPSLGDLIPGDAIKVDLLQLDVLGLPDMCDGMENDDEN
eukprot:Blabericola_migrator_1__6409@NODE_3230_length_1929_cov_13_182599_g2023_i0_p1_GENE_NODE_3230_length_1929_cov_13_182599_g2023_i0NODE_3230_length_1929_cov_13_182599_g2023_i0_p1_ORF_typecomplete_len502_score56_60_NODE_3230_length_1929_cov_13_182599_g2023_i04041909